MTAAEINLALARELERSNPEIFEIETEGQWRDGRIDFAVTDDPSKAFPTRLRLGFSPAEDSNHLRLYVLPELFRRRLAAKWIHNVLDLLTDEQLVEAVTALNRGLELTAGDETLRALSIMVASYSASPSVLAAAALKVLRGEG